MNDIFFLARTIMNHPKHMGKPSLNAAFSSHVWLPEAIVCGFGYTRTSFTNKSVVKNRNPELHEIAKIILGISAPYIYNIHK